MSKSPVPVSPVPSFEAVRQEEPASDLRKNQTIPMKLGLRKELAVHELPSLPAEHLRATKDNLEPALVALREEPAEQEVTKPGRMNTARRQGFILIGLCFFFAAVALSMIVDRILNPAIEAPVTAEKPATVAPKAQERAVKASVAENAAPTIKEGAPVESLPLAVSPKTDPKVTSGATKQPGGKATSKKPSNEFDPNELMFKPQ
jgi:ribosomal protein L29